MSVSCGLAVRLAVRRFNSCVSSERPAGIKTMMLQYCWPLISLSSSATEPAAAAAAAAATDSS